MQQTFLFLYFFLKLFFIEGKKVEEVLEETDRSAKMCERMCIGQVEPGIRERL